MKVKIWFVYENISKENWATTKNIIEIINELEKTYDKEMFDLRSIEYNRFITETKIQIKKGDLPVTLVDGKIFSKKVLPSSKKLEEEIRKILGG